MKLNLQKTNNKSKLNNISKNINEFDKYNKKKLKNIKRIYA